MLRKIFVKTQQVPKPVAPQDTREFADQCTSLSALPALLDSFLPLLPEFLWACEGNEITEGTPVWMSPGAPFDLQRHSSGRVTLAGLLSAVHEGDRGQFRLFLKNDQAHARRGTQQHKFRFMTTDGSFKWFQAEVRRERSADGLNQRLTGVLLNVDDDVMRGYEYDIVMTRFNLSREMLNDGLWDLQIINGDPLHPKNVFWWSPQFRKLLGFETVEEFPDVIESWASRLHPDDSQHTLDAFIKHLNDHSGATGYDVEYRVRLKDGHYRWFRARGQTQRDTKGTPLRAVGALIDIQTIKDQEIQAEHERQRKSAAAASVSEIAELVTENANIAAQIKLISLNASIEAARAGVQGRGFSVIASEIRGLADRTAEITENISRLQVRLDASSRL